MNKIIIKMPPPWVLETKDKKTGTPVYKHHDGRFAVGIEKTVTHALRGHGARGHIIIGTVCHYIEAPSVQSALDRTGIVMRAYADVVIETATDEDAALSEPCEPHCTAHVDYAPETRIPAPVKRIQRTRRA